MVEATDSCGTHLTNFIRVTFESMMYYFSYILFNHNKITVTFSDALL